MYTAAITKVSAHKTKNMNIIVILILLLLLVITPLVEGTSSWVKADLPIGIYIISSSSGK